MTYEELIKSVSLIVENPEINKEGLIIVYELTEKNHKQMNEELFYKSNTTTKFVPNNGAEFEVMLGGILVKFNVLKPE